MCTGLEAFVAKWGATAAAGVGAAASIAQAQGQKKDAKQAVATASAAESERQAAAAQATQNAYAERQWARRARTENSLFTGGGEAGQRQTMGV